MLSMVSLPLIVLLAADPAADSVAAAMTEPREVDQACDSAEKYADGHESEGNIVADVSGAVLPRKGKGLWKVFKSPKDLEGAGEDGAPNSQARVWFVPGGVMFVDAFFQSDSGDWAHFVDYCYRPDGTLARTISTYNTFLSGDEDGISRVRTRHYDLNGNVIDSKQKVLNLKTKKPSRKAKFSDSREPMFFKREDLPFWELVRDGLTRR